MPDSNSGAATSVPKIVADAFEWGSKIANRYTVNFASGQLFSDAEFGDLANAGWELSGGVINSGAPATASTGDLDSASDPGEAYAVWGTDTNYLGSPKIIGGKALLDAIEKVIGTRPTTITIGFKFQFSGTTDNADTTGIGIGNDANALLNAATGRAHMITLGATNFEFWDGAAASDLGVAKDGDLHTGEIIITISGATYTVKLDGTERKASAALTADVWPQSFNVYKGATGSNPRCFSAWVNFD